MVRRGNHLLGNDMSSRAKRSGEPKSYGAPLSTPKPGQTTRKRPQVGDKAPETKKPAKRKVQRPDAPKSKTVRPVKRNPLINRSDSKGRPVGIGGADRERTIMDKVDKAQK